MAWMGGPDGDTAELEFVTNTLLDLLSEDNDTRLRAEAAYDGIPVPEKVSFLLACIRLYRRPDESDPICQVAGLAAILLRRLYYDNFDEAFKNLPAERQEQHKSALLRLVHDREFGTYSRGLYKKISDIIAELARNLIDDDGNNNWPEFLNYLFEATVATNPKFRELALLLFASVPGVLGNQLSKYTNVVHDMLMRSLADQTSLEVRLAAVKATTSFLLVHDKETAVQKQFSDCLSLHLQVLAQIADTDNDEENDDILTQLIDLMDRCAPSFRSQIDFLFQLCMKFITSTFHPDSTRHLALEVLVTFAESAPAMFRKLCSKHISPLVEFLFKMMMDIEDDPDWDLDDDESSVESNSKNIVAETALDRLACALGGKTILPIVMNFLTPILNSADWKSRFAGLMIISAVGEGCHKQMSNLLPQIVDGVLPFLNDSHSRVRYATCNALGQMASDFAPSFQKKFTDKVLIGLLQALLDNRSPRVQAHASAALINLFEDCPKDLLLPYLDRIVNGLENVLNSKLKELVEKGTKLVLEQVVITLSSLAQSVEEQFSKFYDKFMPLLKYIFQNANQPNLRLLRGKTIECISLIGLAVGKEKFVSDAGEVMDQLLKSQTNERLSEDDPQFSYMISSWGRMCKLLGEDFIPYLPYVMEPALTAAALKPEVALLNDDDMKTIETDDNWEFMSLGDQNFGIRTSGLEEKTAACEMLVTYARELKLGFSPYVEETVKLMVSLFKFYFSDGVRSAAAQILPYLMESIKSKGENYVQEMWHFVSIPLLEAMDAEPEFDVLCDQMNALAKCVEYLNKNWISREEIEAIVKLLKKKLHEHVIKVTERTQLRKTDDYDEILEESLTKEDDEDSYILGQVSSVITSLFDVLKEDFFPYFDLMEDQYFLLCGANRTSVEKMWSLSTIADLVKYGGLSRSKYQNVFLGTIQASLSDSNPDLRQTAAYCIGLVSKCGIEYAKLCADCLPVLVNMINHPEARSEENIRATENAISAVTKFLMYQDCSLLPELLLLWLSWLPVWEDKEENTVIYNFLCSLLESNNSLLLGHENCHLPRIVQVIAEALVKGAIDPSQELGIRVVKLMREIQNDQNVFSECISTLNQHQKEAIQAALLTNIVDANNLQGFK